MCISACTGRVGGVCPGGLCQEGLSACLLRGWLLRGCLTPQYQRQTPTRPEVDTPLDQRQTPSGTRGRYTHAPDQRQISPRDNHWSGRYASYSNAFLFFNVFDILAVRKEYVLYIFFPVVVSWWRQLGEKCIWQMKMIRSGSKLYNKSFA